MFWDNLYRACDLYYPSDAINLGACKTTADAMYTAVSLASASTYTYEACPGESYKLGYTNFCFDPQYFMDRATSYASPGNGQIWGAWGNYTEVSTCLH